MLAGLMPSYLTFALLAPVTGLTALTFITSANTYMQLHTDAGVRGRVMALYLMIFMGGTPVGAPIIGWIGQEYGARWTLLGGGLLTIAGVALSAALYLRADRARREGYSPQEHALGWQLWRTAAGETRPFEHWLREQQLVDGIDLDNGEQRRRLQEIDEFENTWFPRTRAIIRRVSLRRSVPDGGPGRQWPLRDRTASVPGRRAGDW